MINHERISNFTIALLIAAQAATLAILWDTHKANELVPQGMDARHKRIAILETSRDPARP
jgi:hypothetical protein